MEQETSLMAKRDDVSEVETKVPAWRAAGFATEEEYNALLKKINDRLKTTELHPWVKEFAGMVNTGKEENTKTISDNDVEEDRYNTKKHFMGQEVKLLEKGDEVSEVETKIPVWRAAGFATEEEYKALLKKIDNYSKTTELHPWAKEFGGIVNTGKEESTKTIFD